MRINNNMMAMNTHRQLGIAQNRGANSMEKLSSGFRINRAGDDAAGLSISEKMRGQIRGLNQASRNAQDGISMIQTAEGALNETHSILQRMRELATQSANDTNVDIDREAIQNEMNQLSSEINRIGNTTEFNSQKILRGEGVDPTLKTDLNLPKAGLDDVPAYLEGGEFTAAKNAAVAIQFGADAGFTGSTGSTTGVMIDQSFTVSLNGQEIEINFKDEDDSTTFTTGDINVNDAGDEVDIYLEDGMKKETITRLVQDALNQAIDVNDAIDGADYNITRDENALTISTVATGAGQEIQLTGLISTSAGAVKGADLMNYSDGGSLTPAAFSDGDVTGTGLNAIRKYSEGTVNFDLATIKNQVLNAGISENNTDYFTAAGTLSVDGLVEHLAGTGFTIGEETIEFFDGAEGPYEGNADFAVDLNDVTWATTATANAAVAGDLTALRNEIVEQIGSKMEHVELVNDAADMETSTALGVTEIGIVARNAGSEGNSIVVQDGVDLPPSELIGSTFEATFQIGANQGQGMTVQITDMRAEALGIVGKAGDEHFKVDGAVFTEVENVTNGTDNEEYIASLDVSSHENATAAVTVLNDAIEKVSAQRSEIGAFQNRLEHTISNLDNSSENLQAAESRIRDVDMANEMMELTKQNILQQASTAMLAQANQAPQSVLQLLG